MSNTEKPEQKAPAEEEKKMPPVSRIITSLFRAVAYDETEIERLRDRLA